MKRVNFTKIKIKNFLSIGTTPVELDFTPGVHIVTGINRDEVDRRNAVGKTSLIESIYFAIFGSTIRDLKKDLIPNTHTTGVCEVVLDFNVEESNTTSSYKIVRTLNPSKLYLFKEGVNVTRDSIKNTEEDIQNILSASPSIFENCVIMTLNNTTPFMSKSKVEKRKFIEGIFNLEIFSQMLSQARDDYSDSKRSFEMSLTRLEDVKRNLLMLDKQKQTIVRQRNEKLEKYEKRMVDNQAEKNKLVEDLDKQLQVDIAELKSNFSKLEGGITQCDLKAEMLKGKKVENTTNIQHLTKSLKQVGTDKDKCPVCLRKIEESDIDHIASEKESFNKQIINLEDNNKKIDAKINDLYESKFKLKNALDKIQIKLNEADLFTYKRATTNERIIQLNEWMLQLEGDIDSLKDTKTDIDNVIEESDKQLTQVKKELDIHKQQLNLLETVKYIVSEEGVKSYIVNRILELFNNILAQYLGRLNSKSMCFFNEYFEEEVINEKRKIWSYSNLSGAERKSIDFACLFTFMDMRRLQGNVTYNISIYDELFDSSLDEKGVDLVTEILKDRVEKHNECVLVISHRKESIKHGTAESIFLEKKNGITKRLDFNPFTDN